MSPVLVLAHVLSQDNPWIPLLTVGGIAVIVVHVLVATGRLQIEEPGDLLLPGASVVLAAGLAGSLASADWLLDQGPWVVPAALVVIVALVVVAVTDRVEIGPGAGRTTAAVTGLALVAGVAAFGPLDDAWFGEEPTVFAVEPGDAEVTLSLVDTSDDGVLRVVVELTGGTIGDNVPRATRPDDPEREMFVKFLLDGQVAFPSVPTTCASDPDCTSAEFQLRHDPDEPPREVTVELLTADQVPFTSSLTDTLAVGG